MWLSLLGYLLHCGSLKPNPQYPQDTLARTSAYIVIKCKTQAISKKKENNTHSKYVYIVRRDTQVLFPKYSFICSFILIGKYLDVGKDWRQKGITEDEMVGRHHRLNGHEFEQTPKDGEGQSSLACYSLRGCRFRRNLATEQLSYVQWRRDDWIALEIWIRFKEGERWFYSILSTKHDRNQGTKMEFTTMDRCME